MRSSIVIQNCDIKFTVSDNDTVHVIETYSGEYRNLMSLIADKIYPEDFGECKGMGRCGSCLIEILKGGDKLSSPDRNEETTVKKHSITNPNYRLACQILVNESLKDTSFKICYDR